MPFLCGICEKEFKYKSHRNNHETHIHGTQGSRKWPNCEKKHQQLNNFSVHYKKAHRKCKVDSCNTQQLCNECTNDLKEAKIAWLASEPLAKIKPEQVYLYKWICLFIEPTFIQSIYSLFTFLGPIHEQMSNVWKKFQRKKIFEGSCKKCTQFKRCTQVHNLREKIPSNQQFCCTFQKTPPRVRPTKF